MNKKRVVLWISTILVILTIGAYGTLFGVKDMELIAPDTYVIHNKGLLGRIGANVVAFEAGTQWVIVDTHLPHLASGVGSTLREIKKQPVALAFNTHWHPDHSGGNSYFTGEARIIAHENVSKILSRAHGATGLTSPGSKHAYEARPIEGIPEELIGDADEFTVNGQKYLAVHYPNAHTDGDLVVYARDNTVIAIGDIMWPHGFPFVDIENGGSVEGIVNALRDIARRAADGAVIITGHGEPLSVQDVVDYADMVHCTAQEVISGVQNGLDETQIRLSPKWHSWSSALVPVDAWVKSILERQPDLDVNPNC